MTGGDPMLVFILFVAVIVLCWWQLNGYMRLKREISQLLASADERLKNVEVARAKRDSVLLQMLAVVREYAAYEARAIESAASYGQAIGILSSIPSRFPTLSADRHYGTLLDQVQKEQSALQSKIESHNAVVRDYNALVNSPDCKMNLLISDSATFYIGEDMYQGLPDAMATQARVAGRSTNHA